MPSRQRIAPQTAALSAASNTEQQGGRKPAAERMLGKMRPSSLHFKLLSRWARPTGTTDVTANAAKRDRFSLSKITRAAILLFGPQARRPLHSSLATQTQTPTSAKDFRNQPPCRPSNR